MGIPSFSGCTSGSYCSDQQATKVGDKQTQIYHRTVTTLTGQGPAYSGSKTETYIIKPNAAGIDTWTLAATTTDGGKTQTFTDAAGADFKKSMAPGGNLNKNVQAQVQKTLTAGGAKQGLVTLPGTSGSLEKITPEQQKALGIVSPNVGNSPTGDGTGAKPLIEIKNLQAAVGKSKKSRADFPTTLRYPLELNSSKQDKIKFDMVEYRPAGATSAQGQFGLNRASERSSKTIGTVFLPIPSGISDTTGCNWGSDTADAAKIAAANVAMGTITAGGTGFTKEIQTVLDTAQGNSRAVGGAVATAIAGDLSGMGGGLLTRVTGAVLNPNLELLFGGGTLRTFSFTFKMSARSEDEAKQIIGILRFFKQGMAPRKGDSNLFLLSPHTFKITYIHKNQTDPHKFLNRFKECALLNLTTNYTPEGQYATFYDGPMVSYEMQMQFQELEPVFNEDYGPGTGSGGPDTEIGF